MDNMEYYRKKFIDELMKLKEKYDLPDTETDKFILDFDNIGKYIDDEKAIESYSRQLLDNVEYRANMGKSPNPYEDLNLVTPNDNDLLFASERRAELIEIINEIENDVIKKGLLKRYEDLDNYIFDDMNKVRKKELLRFTNNQVIEDMQNFKDILNTPYRELQWPATEDIESTFFDYVEPNPIEDEYWAEVEGWEKDADGRPIDPSKKPDSESWSNFQKKLDWKYNNLEIGQMDASTPESDSALNEMEWQEDHKSTAGWPPEDYAGFGGEEYYEKLGTENEFKNIVSNEQATHWWRYDNSYSDEAKDYMERYSTGDLTDEEMQELINDQKIEEETQAKIREAKALYDADVEEVANKAGITDTKAFKMMIQAGTKILQAIDEELLYSPLLLAEKGLNALGLRLPGKAVGGLTRLALAYEDLLFKANVGIAALAHGSLAAYGTASRLPTDIANGIAGLYGAGMPQEIIPQAEGGMSKEEQAKRHQTYFANQMYQYSRMSPSFRLFTDVIGPKTGISDPIQGWQKFGKMLGGDS